MRISLAQTMFSHRWIEDLRRTSSSSVPAPADVVAGGTAGTMASGQADMRCSPSLTNSECNRRTSRNWVVRNLGRLVYDRISIRPILVEHVTYVDVEPQYWVFLAIPLQASDFCRELVMLLLSLWPCPVVSLWLLCLPWSLLRSLLLSLGLLRRIAGCCWLLLRIATVLCGCRCGAAASALIHIAILLCILMVRGRLWRQRGRGDVAGGCLAKRLSICLGRRSPWVAAAGMIRIMRAVVHGKSECNGRSAELQRAVL